MPAGTHARATSATSGGPTRDREWGYRPELDGLRTIAVYAVVIFHSGSAAVGGGFIGVDLFFVLSGFLVTGVLISEIDATGGLRLGAFFARRVRRLLPAALLVALATSFLYVLVASQPQRLELVRDAQAALVYLANWNFVAEANDYFAAETDRSPFLHYWSLSIEEQFYVVYPLLLLLLVRVRATRRGFLVAVLALGLVSVAAQVHWASVDPTRAYYGTDARLYQLLAGAALSMLLVWWGGRLEGRAAWQLVGRTTGAAGVLGLLLLASGLVDVSASHRGLLATLASVAAIGGVFLVPGSATGRLLARRAPVYLGKISYSTYLWHWPIVLITGMLFDIPPWVLAVLAAVGATALAALSQDVFEGPIRRVRILPGWGWPIALGGLVSGVLVALFIVPPVLETDRRPAATQAVGGDAAGSAEALAGRADRLDRAVPSGLDFEKIALDRGPDDQWCTPEDPEACEVLDGDGLSVVLVGDSHARMLAPAFRALAEDQGWRLSYNIVSSCPWQDGVINLNAANLNEKQCREATEGFYDETLPALEPDVVVLAAQERTQRKRWGGRVVDTQGGDLPLIQMLEQTTKRTVDKVSELGARTVLVRTVMGTDGYGVGGPDPLDCLARAEKLVDCAVVPPAEAPIVDSFYDALAVGRNDVSTLDVNAAVCPGAPLCAPILDGRVVWRVGDHITGTIARHVREDLLEQLVASGAVPEGDR
ncbi:acyltransferase family protein [Nocardioides donggukensis]|uniref:Acyltransferase n=1 Tax=Nocardioides donggukensis TaxID=2774019 RepID=A0A927PZL5_9ACTN|nr:acyltransferase family protein [Nocardioides donggukensis]MBD8869355.1 acyltransferase [Nocardioides donggukensis]